MAANSDHARTITRPSSAVIRMVSLGLLFFAMVALGAMAYFTQRSIALSRDRVVHAYRVRSELNDLQLQTSGAQTLESGPLSGSRKAQTPSREQFELARQRVAQLRGLTADDPRQQRQVDQLAKLIGLNGDARDQSIRRNSASSTSLPQQATDRQRQVNSVIRSLQDEEESLLEQRLRDWDYLFKRNAVMLGLALAIVAIIMGYNFRELLADLKQTKETEKRVRDNADSYRLMSAKILELQDLERRRIARELHDSVGQYLAGLKINLSQIRPGGRVDPAILVRETIEMTDCALQEVRTISHLLHPPLLDELGFLSAARWYLDEYGKRSQVKVALTVDEPIGRLPREVEIALFRVLQESLSNVYRHAAAHSVDVRLAYRNQHVTLTIADDGKGIPIEILDRFHDGSAPGIGLGGMRERLAEFGGVINVQSSTGGSIVQAIIPTQPETKRAAS